MLVSQFVSGVSAEFSLVRSGNQLTATFYYGLTGFEDEEGIFHWDGEIGTDIGFYGDYLQQTADRPMDLQLVATMTPGKATTASYFVNDNIGGASFDHQFSVTIFNTAATFVGTSAVDLAFGSAAADEFRSVGAGDMFEGGGGNDLYRIYSADTKIFEAVGQGAFDRIAAGISYVLAAGVEVEQITTNSSGGTGAINLTGNAFSQTIYGNAGANILRDGGGAGDILIGLGGNDTYQIYSTATKIQEGAGQGTADRVMAGVSYTLAAGLDIEIMTTNGSAGTAKVDLTGNDLVQTMIGNAADNRLDGAGGSDSLLGEAGNDTLIGALGNDILDGGSGADTLIGGKGRDIYYVDDAKDAVVELIDGNNGDRVVAEVSYVLGAGVWVEQLTTTSATGTQAINLTGNAMQQLIVGNAGDNILNDGGAGTPDEMRGMGGNDTYHVYNSEDIIVERAGDGTLDVVITNSDFRLAEGVFIERLVLQNPFATNGSHLYGNEVGQTIIGNVGNDVIQTGGGMDTLTGLGGADTFVISALPGAGNFVKITDFDPATETIQLANTAFNTLTVPGTLAGSAFWSNTTGLAHDFSDRIIYETDTGKLYYDEDGVESEPAIHFATLQAGLSLTAADFIVINA